MDYTHFLECCLPGLGLALVIIFLLGAKRRAWIRRGWWLSLILGFVIGLYGLAHSTVPSFSTPITAVGKAYDYVYRVSHARHGNDYGVFRFVPEDGKALNIETHIILPAGIDGDTFRVVYLEDGERVLKNEAVDITILSGKRAGFHDLLDVRPLGRWLAIPIGSAFVVLGYLLFYYGKGDAESAASDDDNKSST
jgi:hypothetical protein